MDIKDSLLGHLTNQFYLNYMYRGLDIRTYDFAEQKNTCMNQSVPAE